MGELIGSSDVYSTWGKFRAPLSNPDTNYGAVWTETFPSWVGSDHNKEFRAGQFCYTEINFCYPPAFFVTEQGSMFRVIPYSNFGWNGAVISVAPPASWYESEPGLWDGLQYLSVLLDESDFEEMLGAELTSNAGSTTIQEESKDGTQLLGSYYDENSPQGAGWYAIEKLQPIT